VIVLAIRGDPKKRLDSVVKMLDSHIAVLDAKLLYIIHSYDEKKDTLFYYEKKLEKTREEIEYAVKLKRRLMKLYNVIEERGGNTEGINDMINDIMHWD
jgi:hypothetical protein